MLSDFKSKFYYQIFYRAKEFVNIYKKLKNKNYKFVVLEERDLKG